MEHIVVSIEPGLFEVGVRIPGSEYIIPTHVIRHATHQNRGLWQVWDRVDGKLIESHASVMEAIESVCGANWALYDTPTRH
jgi:hypothetical protein